jgi:beta-lactamase regulating signal transducer with metallopeptidase domain
VFVLLTELVVKSTLVLLAGWTIVTILGSRSAAVRHAVIAACFIAVLALPLAVFFLPPLRVPIAAMATLADESLEHPIRAAEESKRTLAGLPPTSDIAGNAQISSVSSGAHRAGGAWLPRFRQSAREILLGIWFLGMAVVLLRTAVSFGAARRLAAAASVAGVDWQTLSKRAATDLALPMDIEIRMTSRVTIPLALGIVAPVLLLPAEADDWTADRRRVVLLHELAHVKRRDCLTQAMTRMACAVYWFNPIAWLLASRQLAERERACDDLVLTAGTDAAEYANHLLAIARMFRARRVPAWSTVAMARPSQLEGRLLAILDPSRRRFGMSARLSTVAVVAAALALVALAALEIDASPAVTAESALILERIPELAREDAIPTVPAPPAPVPPTVTGSVSLPLDQPGPDLLDRVRPDGNRQLIDALVSALGDRDRDVRVQAVQSLANLNDPRTVGGLTVALKDADPEVRRAAVDGLTDLDIEVSKGSLLLALADTDAGVRGEAAVGLGELRDTRYLDVFVSLLGDPAASVRSQAARALGESRGTSAVAPLIAALADEDAAVRLEAARSLGEIGDSRAADGLIQALNDPVAAVVEEAACALGEIGDLRAVDALSNLLRDGDVELRRAAASALSELADETEESDQMTKR